jgi:hypothetical protein
MEGIWGKRLGADASHNRICVGTHSGQKMALPNAVLGA